MTLGREQVTLELAALTGGRYEKSKIQSGQPVVTFYTQLQAAKSEEDVKDAYIKALGLKG